MALTFLVWRPDPDARAPRTAAVIAEAAPAPTAAPGGGDDVGARSGSDSSAPAAVSSTVAAPPIPVAEPAAAAPRPVTPGATAEDPAVIAAVPATVAPPPVLAAVGAAAAPPVITAASAIERGDVTFRAGQMVVLGDGFSIGSTASLGVEIAGAGTAGPELESQS